MDEEGVIRISHNTEIYNLSCYTAMYYKYQHKVLSIIKNKSSRYKNMGEEYNSTSRTIEYNNQNAQLFQYSCYGGKGYIEGYEYSGDFEYTITLPFMPAEILIMVAHS